MKLQNDLPTISVIIPFYRGARLISQAVDSVLSQPYKNLEILIVNDGSPTGSDYCKTISDSDSRIHYYHKTNEGAGSARNYGIDRAHGDWLAFLDHDDIWTKNFLTASIVKRINNCGDIVGFPYYSCNHNFTRGTLHPIEEKVVTESDTLAYAWRHHSSMFFRKTLFSDTDIRYGLSSRNEDYIFLQKALYVADSITFINKPLFLYRNNELSVTHQLENPVSIYGPLLNSWKDLLDWHLLKHPDDTKIAKKIRHLICIFAIEAVEMLYRTGISEAKAEPIIDKYFCRDFLVNYRSNMMFIDEHAIKIEFYYVHLKEFIARQYRLGKMAVLKRKLKRNALLKTLNDLHKYPDKLPKNLYDNIK